MRTLIILAILFLLYSLFKNLLKPEKFGRYEAEEEQGNSFHHQPQEREMVRDPVCQVFLPKDEAICHNFDGKEVYFCSNQCADRFLSHRS